MQHLSNFKKIKSVLNLYGQHFSYISNFGRSQSSRKWFITLLFFLEHENCLPLHCFFFIFFKFSQDFRHEVNLLVKLRHPNIVQFLGAVTEKKPLMLITEYLRGVYWFIFDLYPTKLLSLISRCNLKSLISRSPFSDVMCCCRAIFISTSRKKVHLVLQQL